MSSRWTSASSPPSSPSPSTAASRPPPGRCTPCSPTSRPTSPGSSGSSASSSSTARPAGSPRRARPSSAGPAGSRPSSTPWSPTSPRSTARSSGHGPHRDHRHDRPLAHAALLDGDRRARTHASRSSSSTPPPPRCSPSSTPAGSTSPSSPCRCTTPTSRPSRCSRRTSSLVTPPDHPLGDRERVDHRRAGRARAAARAAGHRVPRRPRRSGRAPPASQLRTKAEVDGMRLLASLAFEGFGAAVLPASAVPGWYPGRLPHASPSTASPAAPSASPAAGAACPRRRRGRSARCCFEVVAEQAPLQPGIHLPDGQQYDSRDRCPTRSPITDNRTGESVEIPIVDGGVDADRVAQAPAQRLVLRPRLHDHGGVLVGHHRARRRRRHPALPRLPDRAAGRARRPTSRSPTCSSTASCPTPSSTTRWRHEITYHTFIHENMRKRFMEGFHYDAHPMGMLVSAVAALSTFYLDAKDIDDPDIRHKQIVRLIAKMPTIAACSYRFSEGMPFVWPDNTKGFTENFLKMMFEPWEHVPWQDPVLAQALDVLFILHADHEQNCSTTAMRVVGLVARRPVHVDRGGHRRALRPPPRRRQRGGHPHAHRDRLDRQRRRLRQEREGGHRRAAPGLRPPRLQELRPPGEDHQADRRRRLRRHRQEPAARHRPEARGGRALRRLLHQPQALPERRLLLGPHLPGDGLPDRHVHRCCSPSPARRAGWRTGRSCSSRTRRSPGPASSTSARRRAHYVPARPGARSGRTCTPSRSSTARSSGGSTPTPNPAPARCSCGCGPPGSTAPTGCRSPASTRRRRASPPDIPGLELAGEVAAVGPGATRFAVGDRVMAVVGGGGQAELRRRPRAPPAAGARRRRLAGGRRLPRGVHDRPRRPLHPVRAGDGRAGVRARRRRRGRHRRRAARRRRRLRGGGDGAQRRAARRGRRRSGPTVVDPGRASPSTARSTSSSSWSARPNLRRRPRGPRHRRPHRRHRRRRRRHRRAEPARPDGQARPHPRLDAAGPQPRGQGGRGASRRAPRPAAAGRRPRAGAGRGDLSRWPRPRLPTSASLPAASSARSSSSTRREVEPEAERGGCPAPAPSPSPRGARSRTARTDGARRSSTSSNA